MEELTSKLTAADAARKEREDEFAQSTADKEQALLVEKTAREEVEVKVKPKHSPDVVCPDTPDGLHLGTVLCCVVLCRAGLGCRELCTVL